MAYIIREEDFIVEECPVLKFIGYDGDNSTYADIEELPPCIDIDKEYWFIPINLTINIDKCKQCYKFTIDTDFQVDEVFLENVRSFKLFVNDVEQVVDNNLKIRENDVINIKSITRYKSFNDSKILIKGHKFSETYKKDEDVEIKDIIIN
jgi:hypothetical protein